MSPRGQRGRRDRRRALELLGRDAVSERDRSAPAHGLRIGREGGSLMRQDLRFGARMLRKSPGVTLTVVITLGLGIGLNSAIFSMVSGVLFREPPVQHPDRVVVGTFANPATGSDRNPASALEFSTLRHEGHVFKAVAAASYGGAAIAGPGGPR